MNLNYDSMHLFPFNNIIVVECQIRLKYTCVDFLYCQPHYDSISTYHVWYVQKIVMSLQ